MHKEREGGREGFASRERRELSPVLHNVCLEPSAPLLHVQLPNQAGPGVPRRKWL